LIARVQEDLSLGQAVNYQQLIVVWFPISVNAISLLMPALKAASCASNIPLALKLVSQLNVAYF
jgi:hypothetical protein